MNDIKDIKAPIDIPNSWLWLWIALGVLVVLALMMWLWRWYAHRSQKPQEQPIVPVVPPWEKAYARLENLRSKRLIEHPDLKLFYSDLSDIIRDYLEERFSLRAPEMTTEEFLDSLRVSPLLNDEQKLTLKGFLLTCDMVKFAKHQPGAFEAQKSFELAKQLIDQTHGI